MFKNKKKVAVLVVEDVPQARATAQSMERLVNGRPGAGLEPAPLSFEGVSQTLA